MDHLKVRDTLNALLARAPQVEHTMCPHCKKNGRSTAMKYLPEMSFRTNALFECPRCKTTLDKTIQRAVPSKLGITERAPVYYHRFKSPLR